MTSEQQLQGKAKIKANSFIKLSMHHQDTKSFDSGKLH
jgi:hypothetical protein